MYYLDQIRPVDEIEGLTQKIIDNKEELSLGKLLVENLSSKHFDMSKYSDSYTEELKKLEEAKSKGKTYTKLPAVKKEGTQDLVAALKASLQKTKK